MNKKGQAEKAANQAVEKAGQYAYRDRKKRLLSHKQALQSRPVTI